MTSAPRVRMIAGPNGSGKSTAVRKILKPEWIAYYLNPDDIQKIVEDTGHFDLRSAGISATQEEVLAFFRGFGFLATVGLADQVNEFLVEEGRIYFGPAVKCETFGYHVSVRSDFLRRKRLEMGLSFTFETVMSSRDKVEFLAAARAAGYRTFLYFVATDDPEINVCRVRQRVLSAGHPVPEDKIRDRYLRSLANLHGAVMNASRAFIFDNSGAKARFLAEISDDEERPGGKILTFKVDTVPAWFDRALLSKLHY